MGKAVFELRLCLLSLEFWAFPLKKWWKESEEGRKEGSKEWRKEGRKEGSESESESESESKS